MKTGRRKLSLPLKTCKNFHNKTRPFWRRSVLLYPLLLSILSSQDGTRQALDSLDQEAEEDEVFRADTRAMRTASQEANAELVQKATKWSAILQQAADSDELVRQKWVQWEPNIVELTWSEVIPTGHRTIT